MANNILEYKGFKIGNSIKEKNCKKIIEEIFNLSEKNKCKIFYPEDVVVAKKLNDSPKTKLLKDINSDEMILDVGIKTIKTIMFSHNTVMDDTGVYNNPIEPLRWKLITTRVFLDIPTNEFPDFGQVGGDDYVTIPWPYTTPIIGGVSDNSKYSKSINDILGGGKIGNLDIIDDSFLVEAR